MAMKSTASSTGFTSLRELSWLLAIVVIVVCWKLEVVDGAHRKISPKEEDHEIERQLKMLNKPAIKTIYTKWGDILDCVDIDKQPAFDHPLLKDHKIQMKPSFGNDMSIGDISSTTQYKFPNEECPDGTVPIRRTTKADLIRAKSLHEGNATSGFGESLTGLQYGVLGETYMGVYAAISIYQPTVSQEDQFSSAEIVIENGAYNNTNGIRCGWTVNPMLYGNYQSRLFARWTVDGYQKTGCYNTLCPGFVQVDKQIALGAHFSDYSIAGGPQRYFIALVSQDANSKNWWLVINYSIKVGYWPNEIFTSLRSGASRVFWGGHVKTGANKLSPPMGSGILPKAYDSNRSASCRGIKYVDQTNTLRDPDAEKVVRTFGCKDHYDLFDYQHAIKRAGYTFNFGGPGGVCDEA